ncbi:MAG: ribonuclease E/G, partial [Candidatus Omnitrophota bacterium]
AYRTNCEAAREIAKQIRLRDLGGIIIIDFIDMDSPEHRRSVLKILEESLRKDRAKTSFLNLSQLGLVEMTRQRMRKSLESASSRDCPYCLGRGVVRSGETIAIEAFHKLSHFLKGLKGEHIELVACPEVIEVLSRDNCKTLRLLESAGRNRVSLLADAHIHVEEIRLKRILDKRRKLW